MSNRFGKRIATVLTAIALFFGGNDPSYAANNNFQVEKVTENTDSFTTQQSFVDYLTKQFKKGTLYLDENADEYIDSIYVNGHQVSIKLKNIETTFTKTLKNFELNDITLKDFWVLNTDIINSKKPSYFTINNIIVTGEFKTNSNSINPRENVNLESCETIWINGRNIFIPDWEDVLCSENLKNLLLTNLKIFDENAQNPSGFYLGTKNLETFVLTGDNSSIMGIYFINPENLKTAIYGDNTSIQTLNSLIGAVNLGYYAPGITTSNQNFQNLKVVTFLDLLPTILEGNTLPSNNIITDIGSLTSTRIPTLNLGVLPHANNYMQLLEGGNITSINGNLKYYFTPNELFRIETLGIQFPEVTSDQTNELNDIIGKIDEGISDYDKVNIILKEYLKRIKLTSYNFQYNNCSDFIQLLKKCDIPAYSLRPSYNDSYEYPWGDNIVVVLKNDRRIIFIDVNELSNIISNNVYTLADELKDKNMTLGEAIDLYWETIIDRMDISNCISYILPKINSSRLFIENTVIPKELKEALLNGFIKEPENNKSVYVSHSVNGVNQSNIDLQSCMSKRMRYKLQSSQNASIGNSSKPEYEDNNELSSKEKQALWNTKHIIGAGR